MSPSPRASAWPPSPFVLGGALMPANSGRLNMSSMMVATIVREAGFDRITAFARLQRGNELLGRRDVRLRRTRAHREPHAIAPSGIIVPAMTPPSSASEFIN